MINFIFGLMNFVKMCCVRVLALLNNHNRLASTISSIALSVMAGLVSFQSCMYSRQQTSIQDAQFRPQFTSRVKLHFDTSIGAFYKETIGLQNIGGKGRDLRYEIATKVNAVIRDTLTFRHIDFWISDYFSSRRDRISVVDDSIEISGGTNFHALENAKRNMMYVESKSDPTIIITLHSYIKVTYLDLIGREWIQAFRFDQSGEGIEIPEAQWNELMTLRDNAFRQGLVFPMDSLLNSKAFARDLSMRSSNGVSNSENRSNIIEKSAELYSQALSYRGKAPYTRQWQDLLRAQDSIEFEIHRIALQMNAPIETLRLNIYTRQVAQRFETY